MADTIKADETVDITDVVAKLVFSHFRECHTPTFEGRVVLASKNILAQSASLYLNPAYFT